MTEFKLVLSTKNGKSFQKEVKSPEADFLLERRIGETVKGDDLGFLGYEFKITGGSDKCGFPMRKGIQQPRKKILIGEGVGFSGKKRDKKTQKGLVKRRTVCGELVTKIIRQVNLQVLKEGSQKLGEEAIEAPAENIPESSTERVPETTEQKAAALEPEAKVEGEAEGNPEVQLSDKEKDKPKEEVKTK